MAEFVIIGGGVYGAGVAYWLAEQGAEVVLLEARGIGNGASAGPGKRGTRANGRDVRELPLIRLSHDMWPTLHERLGAPAFFETTGHLQLIEREQDVAAAEARALMQNSFGTETHLLDRSAVRDLEPAVSDAVIGALHCPRDGVTDHTAATEAFVAELRAAGVSGAFLNDLECAGFLSQPGGYWVSGYQLARTLDAGVITELLPDWAPEPPVELPFDPNIRAR